MILKSQVAVSTVTDTVLNQVIGGIADAEGVEPMNLDISLEHCISTDAIQEMVNHESNAWRLQFETPDHVVEITGNDKILIDGAQSSAVD